jgi:uncharacterized OB-fold protein
VKEQPVIEWFTSDPIPALMGNRCTSCGTPYFPPQRFACRNPNCSGTEFEQKRFSSQGTVWSYTDAQYQPPPPYVSPEGEYQPFTLLAVELDEEKIVVLGQGASGLTVNDFTVGARVELVIEELYRRDDISYTVWKFAPIAQALKGNPE